ncbi:hypothetical protein ACFQDZ_22300 [Sulfitobacter pacificus]|uniref:hypothetical protein n=1 Tax=Sulfitobacter pacificus TaxID=1499314 RepID=UPI00360F9A23
MQRPVEFVDPSLILKVEMNGMSMEDDWEGVGLRLLSSDDDNTLVLFSSTEELTEFRRKLAAYAGPKPAGQKDRSFAGFIDRIESVSTLEPRDRLGIRLLERGFTGATDFQDNEIYLVDIELWDFAGAPARRRKAEEIGAFVEARNGEVFDTYVGPSLTIMRVQAPGQALRPVLSVPEVALIDHPPSQILRRSLSLKWRLKTFPLLNQCHPMRQSLLCLTAVSMRIHCWKMSSLHLKLSIQAFQQQISGVTGPKSVGRQSLAI